MFENICNNCLKKCNQCNRYNKNLESISIINSVLLNEETIIQGASIPFSTNRVYITDDIIYNNAEFKILTPGIYKMSFVTNAKLDIGEANENISIALTINGNIIPGTIARKKCGQNEIVNLCIQAIFNVANGTTALLNIVNLKENTPIIVCDNANIIIEKIH